ncbi:putative non-reducing end alpha-L-arabinofuranosidase [Dioscorea sansibarensis]
MRGRTMRISVLSCAIFMLYFSSCYCSANWLEANQTATLLVDGSPTTRKIPDKMFGIFFEEINHAGAGGLWAELVSNRGFEAGGPNTPSNIDPWSIIGNETNIIVGTDRTSCFSRNEIALRMEVLCDIAGSITCPTDGAGIYNPGYWGMNIEQGKTYKLTMYVRSLDAVNLSVSLTSSDGLQNLATANIVSAASDMANWTKVELLLEAKGTNVNSGLQITTAQKGIIWFDQVSLMPLDTYKEHGFRKELVSMLADLKPRFIRFPGGSYVEGEWLRNAFRWRETVGPWEERPGHFGDVWKYWTDDGLGYYEFLQLAEDLGASPVWVINNGISHNDQVDTSTILAFVQDALDSIEFARGDNNSKWGSVRASMGHPEPFELKYVALGNQDCWKKNYQGNYLKFYYAIKAAYPDIQLVSNCDGSAGKLDHPADLYDFHLYTSGNDMFARAHQFDHTSRSSTGPKAFVSEYAATGSNVGKGNLFSALAQAGFLIGLEISSDVVEMASNAPLFVNANDRRWNPDAIAFNSWQEYGTPTYWMQHFFKESSGAILHPTMLKTSSSNLIASAITWQSTEDTGSYLKIKIVNFGSDNVNLKITVSGLQNVVNSSASTTTVLTSKNLMDENSFKEPNKVVPLQSMLQNAGTNMDVVIGPHSLTSFDLALSETNYWSAE